MWSSIGKRVALRQLITFLLIAAALVSLLLAVPPLRRVVDEIGSLTPGWLAAAIAFELLSCASFVVIFRRFFDRVPGGAARRLAWTEMGSGALLPGGGVGALAVGGWLLHRAGMSTKRIVERTSGLFFLTSATNVVFLFGAGVALALGVPGPRDVVRDGLPIIAAVAVAAAVLALPRLMRRGVLRPRGRAALLRELIAGIGEAERALLRPNWRLLGAIGYLGFDIAVLWTTFKAVGYAPAAAPLILAYIIGYLGDLIPVPGGIGVLEGGLAGALVIYGTPVTQATAAVLVYHAVAFWIPSLGGLLAYSMLRRRQLPATRMTMHETPRAAGRELRPTARTFGLGEAADVAVAATARRPEQPDQQLRGPRNHEVTKVRWRPPRSTGRVHIRPDPRAGGGAPALPHAAARAQTSSSLAAAPSALNAGLTRPPQPQEPNHARDQPLPPLLRSARPPVRSHGLASPANPPRATPQPRIRAPTDYLQLASERRPPVDPPPRGLDPARDARVAGPRRRGVAGCCGPRSRTGLTVPARVCAQPSNGNNRCARSGSPLAAAT